MGKSSSSSCLKIIVCGSDSANNDDPHSSSPETKPSSGQRGWSFRKRSGRHRVLGNNVSSETTTSPNKGAPQSGGIEIQSPIKSSIVDEKPLSLKHVEEISKPVVLTENYSEPKPSMEMVPPEKGAINTKSKESQDEHALESVSHEKSTENKMVDVYVGPDDGDNEDEFSLANESFVSKDEYIGSNEPIISESEKASENGDDSGIFVDESVAIVIQTAMRGFLARKEYMRLKSAVKVQAAVRGHLVRRNAVATLHCIRAIVKIQALVRARSSKSLKNKSNDAQFSTVKLLQNSFTRQLLESKSKPKPVSIKCDPMTPNSAWSWLERWMAVSTFEAPKKFEPSLEPEVENAIDVQKITKQDDAELSSMPLSEPITLPETIDSKFSLESEKFVECEENIIINDVSTVDSSITEVTDEQFIPQKEEIDYDDVAFTITDGDVMEVSEKTSLEVETEIPATGPTEIQLSKPGPTVTEPIEIEQFNPGPTVTGPTEIQQPVPGSTVTDPIEIEQPKLSTKRSATSELNGEGKKFTYGSRKASNPAFIAAQSKFEELTNNPSYEESVKKTNESGYGETFATSNPRVHVAGSECGTELSISSTLDSPDRSEIENIEIHHEVQQPCIDDVDLKQDYEAVRIQKGEVDERKSESADPVDSDVNPLVDPKLETKTSDGENEIVTESVLTRLEESTPVIVDPNHEENGYKSTPEASPISHKTVPESQGTPSSQTSSVKGKRNKNDKHGSHKKRSSPTSEKKSPSNLNIDSSARSSTENVPKDHKSGKRRNSFGSTKSDNTEQEPRDSSSRSTLPSYMQATESARAKANSPRSSPDVHEKEVAYSKKRHSLPGTTSKQSSHVNRSTSQTVQATKANGSNSSNERKWLR